jgi:hypothetical protein
MPSGHLLGDSRRKRPELDPFDSKAPARKRLRPDSSIRMGHAMRAFLM